VDAGALRQFEGDFLDVEQLVEGHDLEAKLAAGRESMEQWNEMGRAYWMRFAETKAKMRGEAPDLEYVESRMKSFRQYSLETDQRWRAKHGG